MALVAPRLFPGQASVYPKDGPAIPPQLTRVWAATGPDDRDVLARGLWVADGRVWQVINPPPARLDCEISSKDDLCRTLNHRLDVDPGPISADSH
jgi:hypothetical protein